MLIAAERTLVLDRVQRGVVVAVGTDGKIVDVRERTDQDRPDHLLAGKLLAPGLVDSHARAWPRLAEAIVHRAAGGHDPGAARRTADELVLARATPDDLFASARAKFCEMLAQGVTSVAVLHELQRQPDGRPYDDPPAVAEALMEAAREAGIRMALVVELCCRGTERPALSAADRRCNTDSVESGADALLATVSRLLSFFDARLSWAVATRGVGALPLDGLVALKTRFAHAPLYLPVRGELEASRLSGDALRQGPLEVFAAAGLVDSCTVLTGAGELSPRERDWIALLGASVCLHPPAAWQAVSGQHLFGSGVGVCLGSGGDGSLAELLRHVAGDDRSTSAAASTPGDLAAGVSNHAAWWRAATRAAAAAMQVGAGSIAPGRWADLVAYDLQSPWLAGASDDLLVSRLIAAGSRLAPSAVMVGGRSVAEGGVHPKLEAALVDLATVAERLTAN